MPKVCMSRVSFLISWAELIRIVRNVRGIVYRRAVPLLPVS